MKQGPSLYNNLMPSRNVIKEFGEGSYYHLYNRGVNKDRIFHDDQDYATFLNFLKRHLSKEPQSDRLGRSYKHLYKDVALISYCLMPNHFHLFVLNKTQRGIEELMRSIATSYSIYYNKKYQRIGPLFQGRYKASLIESEHYFAHISRYIHRNPSNYRTYSYSSYQALTKGWDVKWLNEAEFWNTFDGTIEEYIDFVDDYDDFKESLDFISEDLADT